MDAGRLRYKIELQSAESTKDAAGQKQLFYTTYATVWAAIEPLTGREALVAQQVRASVTHKITVYYRNDLKPTHRIKYGSRIFDINVSKNLKEESVWHELTCTERVT